MPLDTLRVIHRIGENKFTPGFFADRFFAGPPLLVDTCQRSIWVGQQTQHRGAVDAATDIESFSGKKAYEFLLKFASGLLSAIPGETNVFGQLKDAWQHHQAMFGANIGSSNRDLMAQLFTDTKRIRSRHLQRIGGHSYGTLIRHLLELRKNEPVLIVGSGSLARSIAPALRKYRLAIWNRRTEAWAPDHAEQRFAPGDEADAVRWAAHIIFCTPPALASEQTWIDVLQQHPAKSVIHLGYRDTPAWWHDYGHEEGQYLHLEHLFALRRNQADARSLQLTRAHNECAALARNHASESNHLLQAQAGPRFEFASP